MDELTPILKELTQQPVAFLGGFFSGILKLNLNDDPVKTWLEKEGAAVSTTASTIEETTSNSGPQSITIE
jgi:hypothetical protein